MLTHLCDVFPHDLYKVRHGVINNAVSPCLLEHDVGSEEIVAGVQTRGETLESLPLQEPLKQILGELGVT